MSKSGNNSRDSARASTELDARAGLPDRPRARSGELSVPLVDGQRRALLLELDAPGLAGRPEPNATEASPQASEADGAESTSDARALTPEPVQDQRGADQAPDVRLGDSAALPDSDAAPSFPGPGDALLGKSGREPDVSTRPSTHVADREAFDVTLELSTTERPADPRQLLAVRFKSAFAAYKLLAPLCATPDERHALVSLLRDYERMLRASGGSGPDAVSKQNSDALHAALAPRQLEELDQLLRRLEERLLAVDESVSSDAFRMRFSKQHESPKVLLRYARFLACRRFDVGYRRDRFEQLARELLTARLGSGKLMLAPRKQAAPVLRQLLKGLNVDGQNPAERLPARNYLRDALDRLQGLQTAKEFFDSGFFLDVYGYKISMHDRVLDPEFLYLCVALDVEIHNRIQSWAKGGDGQTAPPGAAALQTQLRAQEEAVQGVFGNYRKPLSEADAKARISSAKRPPKRAQAKRSVAVSGGSSLVRFAAAALFLLLALGANLFTTGYIHLEAPRKPLTAAELHALSPLLVRGVLNGQGTRFQGMLSRPAWNHMDARERRLAATELAQKLEARGVHYGEVLAYKARAILVEFGSVTYFDAGN